MRKDDSSVLAAADAQEAAMEAAKKAYRLAMLASANGLNGAESALWDAYQDALDALAPTDAQLLQQQLTLLGNQFDIDVTNWRANETAMDTYRASTRTNQTTLASDYATANTTLWNTFHPGGTSAYETALAGKVEAARLAVKEVTDAIKAALDAYHDMVTDTYALVTQKHDAAVAAEDALLAIMDESWWTTEEEVAAWRAREEAARGAFNDAVVAYLDQIAVYASTVRTGATGVLNQVPQWRLDFQATKAAKLQATLDAIAQAYADDAAGMAALQAVATAAYGIVWDSLENELFSPTSATPSWVQALRQDVNYPSPAYAPIYYFPGLLPDYGGAMDQVRQMPPAKLPIAAPQPDADRVVAAMMGLSEAQVFAFLGAPGVSMEGAGEGWKTYLKSTIDAEAKSYKAGEDAVTVLYDAQDGNNATEDADLAKAEIDAQIDAGTPIVQGEIAAANAAQAADQAARDAYESGGSGSGSALSSALGAARDQFLQLVHGLAEGLAGNSTSGTGGAAQMGGALPAETVAAYAAMLMGGSPVVGTTYATSALIQASIQRAVGQSIYDPHASTVAENLSGAQANQQVLNVDLPAERSRYISDAEAASTLRQAGNAEAKAAAKDAIDTANAGAKVQFSGITGRPILTGARAMQQEQVIEALRNLSETALYDIANPISRWREGPLLSELDAGIKKIRTAHDALVRAAEASLLKPTDAASLVQFNTEQARIKATMRMLEDMLAIVDQIKDLYVVAGGSSDDQAIRVEAGKFVARNYADEVEQGVANIVGMGVLARRLAYADPLAFGQIETIGYEMPEGVNFDIISSTWGTYNWQRFELTMAAVGKYDAVEIAISARLVPTERRVVDAAAAGMNDTDSEAITAAKNRLLGSMDALTMVQQALVDDTFLQKQAEALASFALANARQNPDNDTFHDLWHKRQRQVANAAHIVSLDRQLIVLAQQRVDANQLYLGAVYDSERVPGDTTSVAAYAEMQTAYDAFKSRWDTQLQAVKDAKTAVQAAGDELAPLTASEFAAQDFQLFQLAQTFREKSDLLGLAAKLAFEAASTFYGFKSGEFPREYKATPITIANIGSSTTSQAVFQQANNRVVYDTETDPQHPIWRIVTDVIKVTRTTRSEAPSFVPRTTTNTEVFATISIASQRADAFQSRQELEDFFKRGATLEAGRSQMQAFPDGEDAQQMQVITRGLQFVGGVFLIVEGGTVALVGAPTVVAVGVGVAQVAIGIDLLVGAVTDGRTLVNRITENMEYGFEVQAVYDIGTLVLGGYSSLLAKDALLAQGAIRSLNLKPYTLSGKEFAMVHEITEATLRRLGVTTIEEARKLVPILVNPNTYKALTEAAGQGVRQVGREFADGFAEGYQATMRAAVPEYAVVTPGGQVLRMPSGGADALFAKVGAVPDAIANGMANGARRAVRSLRLTSSEGLIGGKGTQGHTLTVACPRFSPDSL